MKDRQQADQQLTRRGLGQLAPLRAHYIVKGLARVVPLNMAFIVGVSQRWYRGVPICRDGMLLSHVHIISGFEMYYRKEKRKRTSFRPPVLSFVV